MIAEPEISVFPKLTQNEKFLIIASDGLWDRLSNAEIMHTVAQYYYPSRNSEGAASHLMRESVQRWQQEQGMVDDITIIVVFLNVGGPEKT